MSKDREKAILTAYISGMKTTDIVNSFKVSTSSISKLLKKYGIESKNTRSENLNQTIYNELALGVSAEIIAKRHKLTKKEAMHKYKEERNRRLINDYTSGSKFDDICEKYSLSNMAVYKILNKNNISRREPHKRLSEAHQYAEITEELKKQIINNYSDGNCKIKDLLAKYNISKHQLYTIIYEAGCKTRNKSQLSDSEKDEIKEKHKGGITITALSREYKVSRALIGYVLGG